jgi:hypothetical protein
MSSFFLFLNSQDTELGTSASFSVDFSKTGIDFSDSEVCISLDYVIFPNLIYPIRSGVSNRIAFSEGVGLTKYAVLADGNYDGTSFCTALKAAFEAQSLGRTYTVSISPITNKITISATGTFSLNMSLSSRDMWKVLGFPYNATTATASTQTGTMCCRLDGDPYVVLMLENLDSPNVTSSFASRGILDVIPLSSAFGDVIYHRPNERNNLVLGTTEQLKQIRVRITDIDGYDIPLGDNAEVFIKLRVISTQVTWNGQV